MLRYRLAAVLAAMIVIALPLALGACGGDDEAEAKPAVHTDFDARELLRLDQRSTTSTPRSSPGTQFVFEGRSNRGLGRLPHQVIFTVTDLTKEINGVRTGRAVGPGHQRGQAARGRARDVGPGRRRERLAAWASTRRSTTRAGEFEQAPDTWLSGVDGAQAGVMMRADPKTGTSSYRQGLAPTIGFADVAQGRARPASGTACPRAATTDVVVTRETNPDEPDDGFQLKYYAPGSGQHPRRAARAARRRRCSC